MNDNDIIVIDDIIPVEHQIAIEKLVSSDNFGWVFSETCAYKNGDIEFYQFEPEFFENAVDTPLFGHVAWNQYGRNSAYFDVFIPILEALPYKILNLERLKVNLTVATKDTRPDTHSFPHIDFIDDRLITGIYYINDSDGDTYIFNEFHPHKGKLTLNRRVTPKRGRIVLFNCNRYHAGNNPSGNHPRLNLNINFYPKDSI